MKISFRNIQMILEKQSALKVKLLHFLRYPLYVYYLSFFFLLIYYGISTKKKILDYQILKLNNRTDTHLSKGYNLEERYFVRKPMPCPLDLVKYHYSEYILFERWNVWLCQYCSESTTEK